MRADVEATLQIRLGAAVPVSGGCISPSFRVTTGGGSVVFLKTAPPGAPADLMENEALSLRVLAAAGAVRVPRIIGAGAGWLALEWLEPAAPSQRAWRDLGRDLARLHRVRAAHYGWERDNYIGPLPQRNEAATSWPAFWVERRLRPQLRLASSHFGDATLGAFERLFAAAPELLGAAESDGASLLHGDLWSGNVHMTADGAALIDPSCCYGHREVDLAMAALFGGFPDAFRQAYAAAWPLSAGAAARQPIYQLYYLLVHVNLFGGGYVSQTLQTLRAALG